MNLGGRVVRVAGGGGSMGRAWAMALARAGADVTAAVAD
jgi:NAD(P)-dependent dehydrogenase (short-subunit alcohol dehydrogenase family)